MDVELQILKHLARYGYATLPRTPQTTVSVVDKYCEGYKDIFCEVRSYECFKYLHLGILAPIPRKSFPEIAKVVGINSPQSLHHFIANSPWSVNDLKSRRLRNFPGLLAMVNQKIATLGRLFLVADIGKPIGK